MSEPTNVVSFDRTRPRPDPARVAEFSETARKLQREREQSGDAVTRILAETPRDEWPHLASQAALRTTGIVERLGTEVVKRMELDPQEALALSNLATSIAETLPTDGYPAVVLAQVRAHAWKDRAGVLRYLGRFEESLDATDRAEQLLAPFPTATHDRAIVRYLRATTLQQVDRFDESLALLNECSSVFFDHGDTKRFLYCGIAEGALLFRRKRYADAIECFMPLFEAARSIDDTESLARIHNNVAHCAVQQGDPTLAGFHFQESMARFHQFGRPVEAIRAQFGAGRAFIASGQTIRGIELLDASRAELLMHGMTVDAALCGVAIVETQLARGQRDAAVALARELVAEMEPVNERAATALAWLRDTISGEDSSVAVQHVSGYLESLRAEPGKLFAAAPA